MTDEQIVAAITTILEFLKDERPPEADHVSARYRENLKAAKEAKRKPTPADYDRIIDRAKRRKP